MKKKLKISETFLNSWHIRTFLSFVLLCSYFVALLWFQPRIFFLFFMFNYEIMAHLPSTMYHSNANVNKVKLKKDLPVKLFTV